MPPGKSITIAAVIPLHSNRPGILRNGGPAWTGIPARHAPELWPGINRNTQAALLGAEINSDLSPPFDYWVIANSLVFESDLSGKQIGEVSEAVIPKGAKILHITEEQFNLMLYEFEGEHDFYPDT